MSDEKPSGAYWRKQRKQRAAEGLGTENVPVKLREVRDAPGNALDALPWCNELLLASLETLKTARGIPLLERIRAIRETAKALGMVFPRAELEKMIGEIVEKRLRAQDKSGGTEKLQTGQWPADEPRPESAPPAPAGGGAPN